MNSLGLCELEHNPKNNRMRALQGKAGEFDSREPSNVN